MDLHHALLGRTIHVSPPLLNSANPWATTREDLRTLYRTAHTGAITTRTCLLQGFQHDDRIHQYAFFDPASQRPRDLEQAGDSTASGSLNTLGYSPRTLEDYLDDIHALSTEQGSTAKPFIVSVTGTPDEVRQCWDLLNARQTSGHPPIPIPLLMEINLSCPNIAGHPPPAYSATALKEYLSLLGGTGVPIGLKVPPYTYHDQFAALVGALRECADECTVSFLTATNTLGSSLVLRPTSDGYAAAIESSTGEGVGGVAGALLHPLALGNVKILSGLLSADPTLAHIKIIGVGGVSDAGGFERMRAVGASAVAVGTALGAHGPDVFRSILEGLH